MAAAPEPAAGPPLRTVTTAAVAAVAVLVSAASVVSWPGPGSRAGPVVTVVAVACWAAMATRLASRSGQGAPGAWLLAGTAFLALSLVVERGHASGAAEIGLRSLWRALGAVVLLLFLLSSSSASSLRSTRWRLAISGFALASGIAVVASSTGHTLPGWAAGALAAGAAVAGLTTERRRHSPAERRSLELVGAGLVVMGVAGAAVLLLGALLNQEPAIGPVLAASSVVLPIALLAAASWPEFSSAAALRWALTAACLLGLGIGELLLVLLVLGRPPSGDERPILALALAIGLLGIAGFGPLRTRVLADVDRALRGRRLPANDVLQTLGARLATAIPVDALLHQLVHVMWNSMAVTSAEIWTGAGARFERAASIPERGHEDLVLSHQQQDILVKGEVAGPAWASLWAPALLAGRAGAPVRVVPIMNSGELLGLIVLERRGGETFDEREEGILREAARQVGLALHNTQLDSALRTSLAELERQAADLEQSRARIVAAADEERRRIERDLHDGVQQHLVALSMTIADLESRLGADQRELAGQLEQLRLDVKTTLQELRHLAHGIYPPLLADSGVVEAIQAVADRGTVNVRVRSHGVSRYVQDVETATYFCCLEALQNVWKHGCGPVIVTVSDHDAGLLEFEVADSGPGFDVRAVQPGHGLTNMKDRLGALGGTLEIISGPGTATRVKGAIPIRRPVLLEEEPATTAREPAAPRSPQ
jgi:signal transduction histidine kinase